jgi:predicted nucleic acid-binding protein
MNDIVIDAGPIIHLSQLKLFNLLEPFLPLHTSTEVWKEITSFDLPGKKEVEQFKKIQVHRILKEEKRAIEHKVKSFRLQSPDISLLTLCHKLDVRKILTDDLELRKAAEALGLETYGSLGVILRAYKQNRLSISETKEVLNNLFNISSLYLSPKLLNSVLAELSKGKKI